MFTTAAGLLYGFTNADHTYCGAQYRTRVACRRLFTNFEQGSAGRWGPDFEPRPAGKLEIWRLTSTKIGHKMLQIAMVKCLAKIFWLSGKAQGEV